LQWDRFESANRRTSERLEPKKDLKKEKKEETIGVKKTFPHRKLGGTFDCPWTSNLGKGEGKEQQKRKNRRKGSKADGFKIPSDGFVSGTEPREDGSEEGDEEEEKPITRKRD